MLDGIELEHVVPRIAEIPTDTHPNAYDVGWVPPK